MLGRSSKFTLSSSVILISTSISIPELSKLISLEENIILSESEDMDKFTVSVGSLDKVNFNFILSEEPSTMSIESRVVYMA